LQRHALQWTGDNSSWWEHLWMAIPQLQNLGLSGVAFCGVDVGGFYGDTNPELLARWTELGIVQPFCRNHSHIESVPQEPWRFGEPWTGLIRRSLELRMRLLPYSVRRVRGVLAHRRADPAAAAVRPPGGRDDLHHRRRAAARRRAARGADHAPGHRAPPRLPPRRGRGCTGGAARRSTGPAHVLAHAPLGQPALYQRQTRRSRCGR
jgi:alpha-glucosidase